METERTPVGWGTWLGWAVASSIGLTIGLAVYLPLAVGLGDELEVVTRTLVSAAAGAGLGASLGVAQWLLLRRRASDQGRWVLASVVGGTVGGAGALVVADILSAVVGADFITNLVLGGTFLGASLGIAQWLLLRRLFVQAGWWVVGSTVGLSLGLGLGRVAGAALHDAFLGASETLARVLAAAIFGTLTVAVYGAITGGVLVWLQRRRSDAEVKPHRTTFANH
jgi:hypothetical protein